MKELSPLSKRLPHNIDAEKAVIGSVLLQPHLINLCSEILHPDDFYLVAHKIIYRALLTFFEKDQLIDIIVLTDLLEKSGNLQDLGGITYLMRLQEEHCFGDNITAYIQLIKNKSILRSIINANVEMIQACYSEDEQHIMDIVDRAEQSIFAISQQHTPQGFSGLQELLTGTLKTLASTQKSHTGVETGYDKLDRITGGLQKKDLIVLAARPSMGKTALAVTMAQHIASSGTAVGIFSLEMSSDQIAMRMLSAQTKIPQGELKTAVIGEKFVILSEAINRLASYKIFIDDTASPTIMDIRSKARKLKKEQDIEILFIDYLQLIQNVRKYETRNLEVAEISRSLKALAKELNIPIVALSQLSRSLENRTDKRPMLSDLRDSGAIEQDADIVLFLYRDVVYNPETEAPASSELIIGKHRNGPTGTVLLDFIRSTTTFEDVYEPQRD